VHLNITLTVQVDNADTEAGVLASLNTFLQSLPEGSAGHVETSFHGAGSVPEVAAAAAPESEPGATTEPAPAPSPLPDTNEDGGGQQ
jgi:hypothetical protein